MKKYFIVFIISFLLPLYLFTPHVLAGDLTKRIVSGNETVGDWKSEFQKCVIGGENTKAKKKIAILIVVDESYSLDWYGDPKGRTGGTDPAGRNNKGEIVEPPSRVVALNTFLEGVASYADEEFKERDISVEVAIAGFGNPIGEPPPRGHSNWGKATENPYQNFTHQDPCGEKVGHVGYHRSRRDSNIHIQKWTWQNPHRFCFFACSTFSIFYDLMKWLYQQQNTK